MKDDDFIEHLFVTSSHDYLLFFSNRGKVYRSKVYELPEAQRTAQGPRARQHPAAARGRADPGGGLRPATSPRPSTSSSPRATGTVKKTELQAYNTPIKADGIIAINIRDDDELLAVRRRRPDDEIIMVSQRRPDRALRRVRRARDGPRHDAASAGWTSARAAR